MKSGITSMHISKFIDNLSKIVQMSIIEKSDLLPTKIFNKIVENNKEVSWISIPKWDLFEYGDEEWGIEEFLKFIKYKSGDELQILTDQLYKRDEVIIFKSGEDSSTFEDVYGDFYGEDFFQPLDYIIIKNSAQVILIHHEGLIAFA